MRTLLLALYLLTAALAQAQTDTGYLTEDGAWCWFSDPRAIMVGDTIVTGWVKSNGTIEAAMFDPQTKAIELEDLYFRLEEDDHDNPAFVTTGAGGVLALYTRHSKKDLFINTLAGLGTDDEFSPARFIRPLSKEQLEEYPRETVTYANPFSLKAENNRIYSFGRWAGYKPNMMWSDDNGDSWTKGKVFITNYPFDAGNRPYVKYASDGNSKVHIAFTDGHPRNEATNSVYYAYYEDGAFYRIDGEKIVGMEAIPFEPKDASVVYSATSEEGRAWIADVGQDSLDEPVILYTKSPDTLNHEYWYARHIDGQWVNHKICDSGKWFPQTPAGELEREPHYFGGMTVHPDDPNVVYLSRQVDSIFEIERWETADHGENWTSTPVTQNSTVDNVRPYLPRGMKKESDEVVLWMENQKYIHYTDYKTSVRYAIRKAE